MAEGMACFSETQVSEKHAATRCKFKTKLSFLSKECTTKTYSGGWGEGKA